MPVDSKECDKHALRCAQLAVAPRTPQLKAIFWNYPRTGRNLQTNWKAPSPEFAKVKLLGRVSESPSTRLDGLLAYPFGTS